VNDLTTARAAVGELREIAEAMDAPADLRIQSGRLG
jgi:hypothetical protein